MYPEIGSERNVGASVLVLVQVLVQALGSIRYRHNHDLYTKVGMSVISCC